MTIVDIYKAKTALSALISTGSSLTKQLQSG